MKRTVIAVLGMAGLMVGMTAAPCFADNEFYIELGTEYKKDEATKEWSALVAKHKTLLGKLHLFPKDIIQEGAAVSTRIQAGPIASKAKAQKICTRLFSSDVPCFVIEGVGDAPPSALMNLSEKAGQTAQNSSWLPWQTTEAPAPAPAQEAKKEEQHGILPWLLGDKKKAAAMEENRQGKVQVAEAIRVPLSDQVAPENSRVTVRALPAIKSSVHIAQADSHYADESTQSGAGWLVVSAFPNQDIATSFWDEVRATNKKQAKTLSVRVDRPALDRNQSKTNLSVGPFANSSDAYEFCRNSVQASARGLACSFTANDSGAANHQMLAQGDHGNAYADRQQQRHRFAENPPADLMPAAGPSRQYWVQVVSAGNQMDALHQWETLKAANTDIVGNMRSSVSKSAADQSSYVVRVGPLAKNDDAIKLCSKMQERNIDCRVLMYSMGM